MSTREPEATPPRSSAPRARSTATAATADDLRQALSALSRPVPEPHAAHVPGTGHRPGSGRGSGSGPGSGSGRRHVRSTTSDLSIDEVLLLHSIGWEPVDLVFGVSWWSVPWGAWQWQTGEIGDASSAFTGAVDDAAQEMRLECEHVGGAGVVGVHIELRVRSHHVDVALTGTAVRPAGGNGAGGDGQPFLSDLSARDFALLTRAGWRPLGLAAGASFVVAPRRTAAQWASQQGQNTELPHLTEALYLAREQSMHRMQQAGLAMAADGIVNVTLREGPLGYSARVMQFVAIGTGVKVGPEGHRAVRPRMVVPLDDAARLFDVRSLRGE